ncbi:MAG: hypothetical protein JWM56_111 [Candidatus Peribacteria bacterium]|nr:hypothetical protein [Candidatus Peribacteria bacterium]
MFSGVAELQALSKIHADKYTKKVFRRDVRRIVKRGSNPIIAIVLLYSNCYKATKAIALLDDNVMADHFPKLMGMGDVTKALGVTRQYIDYLVETGRLRCQRISTGKVFLASDIDAFKKERLRKQRK